MGYKVWRQPGKRHETTALLLHRILWLSLTIGTQTFNESFVCSARRA